MGDRFVVVGGDAAGMSAASKAKRDRPELDVVVFERSDWVAYGACGIPYYVEGVIEHLDDLVIVGPDAVAERGIDLHRESEVVDIDPAGKTVTVVDETGRFTEPYDDLLLATGGRGVLPDIPGADLDGVFTVRNLEEGQAIRDYVHPEIDRTDRDRRETANGSGLRSVLQERDPEVIGILGANKIGIEFADAFLESGFAVHVFESADRILPAFGSEIAAVVEKRLRERDVTLHLDTAVRGLRGDCGWIDGVRTGQGEVPIDALVADIAVAPNTELATTAGIDLGPTGGIARDERGRTSIPHIYAAGDCAEKHHLLTDEPIQWPYDLAANRSGRAIGRTVGGTPTTVGGVVGTGVMKAFDLELSRAGLVSERAASRAGFEPVSTTITSVTRAHYYPGWSRLVVHMLADRSSGRMLGGGLVGAEGAAHRINAVATALHAEMTIEEVEQLDLAYAPPFGPVWDPILTAAKVLGEELS